MVQGYYTLEDAARILGLKPERLNQMAQKREIRAFADRGSWRFRTEDIDEMARRMGIGSNPELQLGEADKPKPASSAKPKSGPRSPGGEGVFDFSLNPAEPSAIDHDIVIESPSSQKLSKGSPSPTPKPGSDSDVHLVFDVGGDFPIIDDSDVKLQDAGSKTSKPATPKRTNPSAEPPQSRKKTMMPPPSGSRLDSGVRLVPMEEGNVLPIGQQPPPSGTDSDIRLTPDSSSSKKHDVGSASDPNMNVSSHTTEDINLDEELRRAEETARAKKPRSKAKPKTDPKKLDTSSSQLIELPESNLEVSPTPRKSPAASDQTAEMKMPPGEDELILGELEAPGDITGSTNVAGINLHHPADSGVNLEKRDDSSSDSLEFELSLEPESTPRPAHSAPDIDSSSEFELTLDEGSGLAPIDEEDAAASGDKDIFETDFDIQAVDESGAGAVNLEESDTELESSSDFDLALGEEESGSQVVALEGEEADESAATVAYKGKMAAKGGEETDEMDDLLSDDEIEEIDMEEDEGVRPARVVAAPAAPANWGLLPALALLPTVIIMFVLSLMSFELLHNMWGYKQPYKPTGMLVKTFSELFGDKIPE